MIQSPYSAFCFFYSGDCLGALLRHHNQKSPIYLNISVNDNLLPVICDQSTNGGGWLIIGQKLNTILDFDRSREEYAYGFGQLDDNFWLGSKWVAAITKQPVQLLIEIQNDSDQMKHAAYRYFKMDFNNDNDTAGRIVHYTGNAGDVLEAENSSDILEKIKNLFMKTTLKRVEMKIRPNMGKYRNVVLTVYWSNLLHFISPKQTNKNDS